MRRLRRPPSLLAPFLLLSLAPLLLARAAEEVQKKRDAELLSGVCATCHANATCQQHGGKNVCICNYGFVGNGRTYCQDKDECQIWTICGEHASCHNTEGSFYCTCVDGYQASSKSKEFIPNDGTYCSDIDECIISDICGLGGQCVNTDGSYDCSCIEGYTTENGTDKFHPPTDEISCKVVDCGLPPSLPNAYLASVTKTTYGSKVVYTCQPPYVIESGNWTAVCNSKGQWEGANLLCKEANCGEPPWLPNADIIWDNTTTLGSRIYYLCREGFQPFGERNFSQCTITQKWENITFECKVVQISPSRELQKPRSEMRKWLPTPTKEINCGQPPLIPHSDMIWDNSSQLGSAVKYRCIKGFFTTSMKRTSTCTNSGLWETLDLICEKGQGFFNLRENNSCLSWRRRNGSASVNETYRLTVKKLGSKPGEITDELKINFTTLEEAVMVCLPLRQDTNYSMKIAEESTSITVRFSLIQPVVEKKDVFGNISIFNDTCIKWQRESGRALSEETYVFHIQGLRWYQKEFHHKMTHNFTTHSQMPEVCLNLSSGSNYTVNISIENLNQSFQVHMTTPITEPQSPEVEFVSIQGSVPLFSLRKAEEKNGPISSYQVIVVPWSPQCNFSCYSLNSLTYFNKGTDSEGYVAAEFPAKVIVDNMFDFALGDRLYYGEFYNAPLKQEKDYCIILRTISEWNETSGGDSVLHTKQSNLKKDLSSSPQHVTAVLLGSVAVLCSILLLSLLAARSRETREEGNIPEGNLMSEKALTDLNLFL